MIGSVLHKAHSWVRLSVCALLCAGLGACSPEILGLTPTIAEPKTPPARNITSFGPALHCMDDLLLEAKRPRVRITSTQLPDRTKKVFVGANDMLINAVNQMNRRSHAFVFVDQAIAKSSSGHLLEIETLDTKSKVKSIKPQFYIRGSISQLDENTHAAKASLGLENTREDSMLADAETGTSHGRSVVTVDLHLVAFPSRLVVPGASVSNSMVVTKNRFGAELSGDVFKIGFGPVFEIENMESRGQAVRNLIELGVIELLGQYSKVPYWDCLALETRDAQKSARQEHVHVGTEQTLHIKEAQTLLIKMHRLSGVPNGKMDPETQRALALFQKENGLIANGSVNFDTLRALRMKHDKAEQRIPRQTVSSAPVKMQKDGFRSINAYLKPH